MAKSLVIVESPAKAKTINKFLGSEYIVKPTGGHIIDLPEKEIGIDIANGFAPRYIVIKGKAKIISDLKKAAQKVDDVFLATDPDREGEAIAWHVANNIVGKKQPSYRILLNQITRDAVINAINNKGELDLRKVNAQQTRRILDRLVGYKVSPFLWKTMYSGLSAGRVQSVALRLIVERDEEINAFVPEEYWDIKIVLSTEKGEEFEAKLIKKNGKTLKMKNSEESSAIVKELSSLSFYVYKITKKNTKRNPLPPLITSTLQQEAASRYGFTVSRTMRVAQTLYEGVELTEDSVGLITYMRTDSTRIAPEAIQEARNYIANKWGQDKLPSKPNIYKTRKSAQDAHEAIRPSSVENTPESVKKFLSNEQLKVYTIIWNRFIASQMKPTRYTVITAQIYAGEYELSASASHVDFKGYLTVYEDLKKEDDKETLTSNLPKTLADGDPLNPGEITPAQHFTKPPPRYTEASLVREMESQGLGRPSTYVQIINTIQAREYVKREKGKLHSTELGRNVNMILVKGFPDLFSVEFTATMEEELDKIESGEYEWHSVLDDFYGPFNKALEKINIQRKELKKSLIEETDEVCEKCGKPMVIRWGRNGKFMACSGFPECRNTKPLEEKKVQATDETCEKCGKPMIIKMGRKGEFMACSGFPECRNIKPLEEKKVQATDETCEKCGKPMVIRWGRKGEFMACSGFPECRNTKPLGGKEVQATDEVCEKCGSPMKVKSVKNARFLACSNYPECKNTMPLSIGVKCIEENCDGEITEKRTKKGKRFYGCTRYPDCKFASWNRPVNYICKNCGAPALFEEKDGETVSCVRCKSKFEKDAV